MAHRTASPQIATHTGTPDDQSTNHLKIMNEMTASTALCRTETYA
ncbi:hypothetical protein [Marivivens aquimaris]|nr:hypothetical protein [Marivivens aquimaris]